MATPPEPKREGFIPRAPKVQSTTDYIVLVFVILVATILLGLSFTALYAFLFTDKEVGPFIAIITDLMTTIIAALVGFLAGKNSAKIDNGGKQ
jgi:hypothetical protein